jgi:hypothetical protein
MRQAKWSQGECDEALFGNQQAGRIPVDSGENVTSTVDIKSVLQLFRAAH